MSLFFIKSQFNGRVLDVEDGSTEDEANIIVYHQKYEDSFNQLWRYEDGYFINAKSAKVLDISGGEMNPESQIIQYSQKDYEEAANQRWQIDEEGYIFCMARPDLVLDIQGGEDGDCVPVILYERREGEVSANQRWVLEPFEG
ncbi:ricin B lectin domain-containing protein [Gilbertella persicaria]|uniref:Ricin B lectin domain-containing protein n=1 Tax=Rhizopus stolonifer TaxID=4846 RepID=A0A367IZ24_RHIST|nr:ricin B lectin domain-containing protein [Gilbertella persicaria]KAI8061524.1 ricin B lectin domain-containing protein [Gilbertella persicaria]RCH82711.1 hypothetical protein CU098_008195 [Rhizopus stolonifer]